MLEKNNHLYRRQPPSGRSKNTIITQQDLLLLPIAVSREAYAYARTHTAAIKTNDNITGFDAIAP